MKKSLLLLALFAMMGTSFAAPVASAKAMKLCPAPLPTVGTPLNFSCNFENDTENSLWHLVNGSQNNQWVIDTAAHADGNKGLYVSNDNGAGNSYSGSATFCYATRSLGSLDGGTYKVSYDWRCAGESNYDYIRVFLAPDSTVLTPGISPLGSTSTYGFANATPAGWVNLDRGSRLNGSSSWSHLRELVNLPDNGQWKIVVVWCNDGSIYNNPAGAIDNFVLNLYECYEPIANPAVTTINSLSVSWTEQGTATSWVIEIDTPEQSFGQGTRTVTNITSHTFTDLLEATEYHIYVAAACGGDDTSSWLEMVLHTSCPLMTALPYYEDFESLADGSLTSNQFVPCWKRINNGTTYFGSPFVATDSVRLFFNEANKVLVWHNNPTPTLYGDYQYAILPGFDTTIYPTNTMLFNFWSWVDSGSYEPEMVVGMMSDPNDLTTFEAIDTITLHAYNDWHSNIIFLYNYTGNGNYIALKSERSSTEWTAYLDNFSFRGLSACATTVQLAADHVGTTAAHLSWDVSDRDNLPDEFTIVYNIVGDSVADTLHTVEFYQMLSGLYPNTEYEARVFATCGDGIQGVEATTSFTTSSLPCLMATDSSSSVTYTILTGTAQTSSVPVNSSWGNTMCQSIYTAQELRAAGVIPGVISGLEYNFTSNDDYAKSWSIYMGTTTMDAYASNNDQIDPSTQTLVYGPAAHPLSTSGWQTYHLDQPFIWDGTSNIVITTFMNQPTGVSQSATHFYGISTQTNSNRSTYRYMDNTQFTTTNYTSRTCYLSTYVPTIRVIESNCAEYNTCTAPLVVANMIESDFVEVEWAPGYEETSWMVEYRHIDGDWIVEDSASIDNSYFFSELTPGSHYEIRITSLCSDTTNASSTIEIVTACGLHEPPFTENFEHWTTTGYLPECWMRYSNIGPNYPAGSNAYSYAGSYSMMMYSTDTTYSAVVLPQMANWANENQVSFRMYKPNGTYRHRVLVGITLDPDDITTFVAVDTVECENVGQWEQFDIPLDTYEGYGDYITLMSPMGETSYPYIDNLVISEIPTCRIPSHVRTTSVGSHSIALQWQSEAERWFVEYDTVAIPENEIGMGLHPIDTTTTPSILLEDLQNLAKYYIYIYADCGFGDQSLSYSTSATTLFATPAELPYVCDFEDAEESSWQFMNGSQTNQWGIGNATQNGGANSLYITNDLGQSNAYTNNSISTVFAQRDINFTDTGSYRYSYDWKAVGESCCDYMNVALVPMGTTLTTGSPSGFGNTSVPEGSIRLFASGTMNSNNAWTTQNGQFDITTPGLYKLVFYWHNDGSIGSNPPAAVDNIVIHRNFCYSPTNLVVNDASTTSINVSWQQGGVENRWLVTCGNQSFIAQDTIYTITGLQPSTSYTINVYSLCSDGDTSLGAQVTAFTSCGAFGNMPLVEDFSSYSSNQFPNCWSMQASGNYPYVTANQGVSMITAGTAAVITPRMPAPLNGLYISFDLRKEGSSSGTMALGYTADPTSDSIVVLHTYNPETNGEYYHYELDLATENCTDSVYFVWKQNGSSNWYYWIDNIVIEPTSTCPLVANITIDSITHRQATIHWEDTAADHTGVNVYLGQGNDRTQATLVASVDSGTTSYTFTNLNGNTHYYAWVIAACGDINSRTAYSTFTTNPDCSPVRNLTAHDVDYYGFRLSWEAPAEGEPATQYIVDHKASNSNVWISDTTDIPSFYFSGLDTNTTYNYRVSTLCSAVGSSYQTGTVTTLSCTYTLGQGATSISYLPTYTYYNYSYTQQILLENELPGIDTISKIAFYCNGAMPTRNLTIYMANTQVSEFASTADYIDSSYLTQVFSGSVSGAAAGWVSITLDTAFVRNENDNLLIAVDDNTGSWVSSPTWATNITSTTRAMYFYQDNSDIHPTAPSASMSNVVAKTNQIRISGPSCSIPECNSPSFGIVELTDEAVTFVWNTETDSTNYRIEYKLTDSTRWIPIHYYNDEGTQFFNGLQPNTEYDFRLSFLCGDDSLYSIITIITHRAPCPVLASDTTVTACESFVWHGVSYTESTNSATHVYVNDQECDSVVTLHLNILHNTASTDNVTACDNYTWFGTNYTASATDTHTLTNAEGCDSTITLNLTIHSSSAATESVTACDSYTWHGTTYTAATSTATYTTVNAEGCDSVVTLLLTLGHSNTATETLVACDSLTWHGTAYTASTTSPTFTTVNAEGCDSVITLNLTVNYSNSATETLVACDSLRWHDILYTASTSTPTFTTQNADGCDSVVTLNLTVNYATSYTDNQTACDSLMWNGTTYTESVSNEQYHSTNAQGCDSTTVLNLTLHYSNSGTEVVVTCDSMEWNGNNYFVTNHEIAGPILTNMDGCDSVTFLDLTIHYSTFDTIADTAVGSMTWNGQTYTESGEYRFEGVTENGCDSIVTLILTIVNEPESISEAELAVVNLYPNPTSGLVNIEAENITMVEVYDYAGRLIERRNAHQIDLTNRPSGTYVLRITTTEGVALRRVVKK